LANKGAQPDIVQWAHTHTHTHKM